MFLLLVHTLGNGVELDEGSSFVYLSWEVLRGGVGGEGRVQQVGETEEGESILLALSTAAAMFGTYLS